MYIYRYIPCINLTASISQDFHFQVQCQFLIRFVGFPTLTPAMIAMFRPTNAVGHVGKKSTALSLPKRQQQQTLRNYSYGHLSVITGYFSGIIHSINGVFLVLITGKGP